MIRGLALSLLLASPALADERIGAFVLPDSDPTAIVLDGEIGMDAPSQFAGATARRPGATTVVLNSPGGFLTPALDVAYAIHLRKMATLIRPSDRCTSACSFVFMAGAPRVVDGKLGVHQGSEGVSGNGVYWNVMLVRALTDFDTPQGVMDAMFATPSDQMHVFTPDELEGLGLVGHSAGSPAN